MHNQTSNDASSKQQEDNPQEQEEEEDSPEEFQCCVCLDLLYKPVVLACGHLSCFWCVYNAMNRWLESHCPICRHPYNHFPSVCQLLHFLLNKMYPIAYKRRERQVGEEEKKLGHFSPQFDQHMVVLPPVDKIDVPSNSLPFHTHSQKKLCPESCFSGKRKSSSFGNLPEASVHNEENVEVTQPTSSKCSGGTISAAIKNCSLIAEKLDIGAHKQVTVADLLCAECKKLLFRPVVLNCGHVYCESCIIIPTEGNPRCQICQSLHPNGFPSVCLVLEHFLEEHFSKLYAEKQESFLKQTDCSTKARQPATCTSLVPSNVYSSWMFGNGPKVHFGFGCDSCGMSPIIGERYRCKDCVEKIGFDLCEECNSNPPKMSGRFNQQHKPDHNFEIVQPQIIRDLITCPLNLGHFDEDRSDAPDHEENVSLARVDVNEENVSLVWRMWNSIKKMILMPILHQI